MWVKYFDSFNLRYGPAESFIRSLHLSAADSLAAVQESVVMEMVDKGGSACSNPVGSRRRQANNSPYRSALKIVFPVKNYMHFSFL